MTDSFDLDSIANVDELLASLQTPGTTAYKVRGRKDAPEGAGVLGHNTATTGVAAGVSGQTDSKTDGTAGVYGEATAATGAAYGLRGVTNSGQSAAETEPSAGVRGESQVGRGVYGVSEGAIGIHAAAVGGGVGAEGFNVGLWAHHDGSDGSAIQGQSAYSDNAAETEGVWGRTDTPGDASSDLYPVGVRGTANAVSGTTLGVRGDISSLTGPGVIGVSATSGYSFSYSGTNATGVTGVTDKSTDTAGLDFVAGVEGVAMSGNGHGVYGRSDGGYGLATPDDLKLEGLVDTNETDFVVETGDTSTPSARNVIQGHASNVVTDGAEGATIAGGGFDDGSTVEPNKVHDQYGTVAGGAGNEAGSPDGEPSSARRATVGGGLSNAASAVHATVAGGHSNVASGDSASVGGGENNEASGDWSSVHGGLSNEASAPHATVPGGNQNVADGQFSFAAGTGAKANGQHGVFVWSDSGTGTFSASAPDQFLVDAAGGVGIGTNDPTAQLEVDGDSLTTGRHEVTGELDVGGSPSFSEVSVTAELTFDQLIGGTEETVQFDVADDDWGSAFDTSTGEFTVPADGKYRVTVHLTWNDPLAVDTLSTAQLQKGGFVEVEDLSYVDGDGGNGRADHSFSKVVSAGQGQVIETTVKQDTGTDQDLRGNARHTYMCITKIG
jgi:hypothetical protein